MFKRLSTAALIAVAIINFLPVIGVYSETVLSRLYNTTLTDPDIILLLRHRALLFGLLGGLIFASVFRKEWRGLAIVMAAISMAGFIVLALMMPTGNPAIAKVVRADTIALTLLVLPAIRWWRTGRSVPAEPTSQGK